MDSKTSTPKDIEAGASTCPSVVERTSCASMKSDVDRRSSKLTIAADVWDTPKRDDRGHKNTCFMTAMLIVGDVLGAGILGLPAASAKLGWVLTMVSLLCFGFFSSYAGQLVARVKNEFYPSASSYAELARETGGPHFFAFTQFLIVGNWVLLLPYYLVATGSSLSNVFSDEIRSHVCGYTWSLIATACLVLPTQLTTLKYVAYLAAPSVLAILAAVVLTIILLFTESEGHAFGNDTSVGPVLVGNEMSVDSFFTFYAAFSSIVFAFQGQDMFTEMIDDMVDPKQAGKAVAGSYWMMTCAYGVAIVAAYGNQGQGITDFLPDALHDGWPKAIVNFLVAFHVLVAYVITGNITAKVFYKKLFPKLPVELASEGTRSESVQVRLRWLMVSGSILAFGFVVANLIPEFGSLQALVGSIAGAPIVFGFPPAFYLLACRKAGKRVSWFDGCVCALFLCILLPSMTILGTIGSVRDIIHALEGAAGPFACSLG